MNNVCRIFWHWILLGAGILNNLAVRRVWKCPNISWFWKPCQNSHEYVKNQLKMKWRISTREVPKISQSSSKVDCRFSQNTLFWTSFEQENGRTMRLYPFRVKEYNYKCLLCLCQSMAIYYTHQEFHPRVARWRMISVVSVVPCEKTSQPLHSSLN